MWTYVDMAEGRLAFDVDTTMVILLLVHRMVWGLDCH